MAVKACHFQKADVCAHVEERAFQARFVYTKSAFLGQLLLLVLLASLLTGCGFHLRGLDSVGQVQFKRLQLNNLPAASREVQKALRNQLKLSGVQLVDSIADAEVQITLQASQFKASRTAFSDQGDATAEMLKMSQAFSAMQVSTEQTIVSASVQTYRDRQIETSALLAADSELKSIKQDMATVLARQILDRVNRGLIKLNAANKDQTQTEKLENTDAEKPAVIESAQ